MELSTQYLGREVRLEKSNCVPSWRTVFIPIRCIPNGLSIILITKDPYYAANIPLLLVSELAKYSHLNVIGIE